MVRRRQLGLALRSFRGQAGLSVAQVATRLLVASSKISRIETAQRNPTLRDVRDLCQLYGVPDKVRDQLMGLAQESRQRAWWHESNLDPALETLIGMEGAAKSISEFEPLLIPGLLQTPEYARAVVNAYRGGDTGANRAVFAARMRRQHILQDGPSPRLSVVLDEAALRRRVGGTAVMREQLQHLADSVEQRGVLLQVIPFAAGVHIGTLNGFIILEFDQPIPSIPAAAVPGVVYVETLAGGAYYDQPGEVERHLKAFTELSKSAYPPEKSLDYLRALRLEI